MMSDEPVIDGQTAAAPAETELTPDHGASAQPGVVEASAAPAAAPAALPALGYGEPVTEEQMRSVKPGAKIYGQSPWSTDAED